MPSRKTIEDMQKLAAIKDGFCLSTEYNGCGNFLVWQCDKKHRPWNSTPNSIRDGSWCPSCAGNAKLTLEDMQQIAIERGGKCLSFEYKNSKTKLEWQCSYGHIWLAMPEHIKIGTWCPYCDGKHKTIEEAHILANSRNGKCLSIEYINSKDNLEWQCEFEHIWHASFKDIQSGNWCPFCAGKRITIEDIYKLAEERGGKCLSTEYLGAKTNLQWQCKNGHEWLATLNNIKNHNRWCPYCKLGFNQEFCRLYLEELFEMKFPSVKPDWLRIPGGRDKRNNLQLDGYCADLNLAFEYNGEQHYMCRKFSESITDSKAEQNFILRKKYDELKIQLCKIQGVRLVVIPFWENENIARYINTKLNEIGFSVIKVINTNNIENLVRRLT